MKIPKIIREAYKNRRYHSTKHIKRMLKVLQPNKNSILYHAVLWHDFVYKPRRDDNEEQSVKAWVRYATNNVEITQVMIQQVSKLILATKLSIKHPEFASDKTIRGIILADIDILINGTKEELIEYERGIFLEYQYMSLNLYKSKRIKFLKSIKITLTEKRVNFLIDYIKTKTYRVGYLAASFNPLHKGHFDVLKQAEKMFDKVVLLQGWNKSKEKPEKLNFPTREVIQYDGLVMQFFNKEKNIDKFLVRGIRNGEDLLYETNLNYIIQEDTPIKFVYLLANKKYAHLSSSILRRLKVDSLEIYNRYIP